MVEDQIFIEDRYKQEEVVRSLVQKYSDFSSSDLSNIITKYLSYEPEAVRAALYVSVEKGLISYDLKELLWRQIDANFDAHRKHNKKYTWEKTNAFIQYVSAYTDDQIYEIIDDPHEIVIDIYLAVLSTARGRELISDEDLKKYYADAKSGTRTLDEIRNEEFGSFFRSDNPGDVFENEAEMEAEREKFWKCPECNQMVGMEFGVCWNCETEIPLVFEHPAREEIIKEIGTIKAWKPVKSGFYLIVLGAIIALWEQFRPFYSDFNIKTRFIGVIFGGFFAAIGVFFVVYGLRSKSDDNS